MTGHLTNQQSLEQTEIVGQDLRINTEEDEDPHRPEQIKPRKLETHYQNLEYTEEATSP